MAAVRMLAYGCPIYFLDEYVQIGESVAIESLKHFFDVVIRAFETQYLRKPNTNDIARLLKEREDRGFPEMLGSLDYMHWHWNNCPTEQQHKLYLKLITPEDDEQQQQQ
ncbi:hypothetical protein Ddye_001388 [Dipteronia dyeriana]|uniref:Uncharacterized protein n=1 Tax=Dipteronia dyeriana TaxID=168575 RepID=A0AAE0CTG9_9ROSI|nr:hypothetical protein Ddye_001388 [Dipteronia dyeriana]